MNMTSLKEHLKNLLEDENVKGLRFVNGNWYQDCKKVKHDIELLDDTIVYTEKKGAKNVVYIPLHSCAIFVLK